MVELLERDQYINDLLTRFQRLESDGGHAVFIRGEAGIGKTSLLNYLTINLSSKAKILSGSCDSLFTPRPLGPIFDMARLISSDFLDFLKSETNRSIIFEALVDKLSEQSGSVIMIFEDIHWADEATLDFIKFITKRINKYKCLFLLTYRSDEINSDHPLSAIFGDLPSLNYSKVELKQFSHKTVNRLAFENDLLGDQLYSLTAGNPFYVMEVLKHKNSSIPERIKDLVLAVFSSKDEKTKEFLEILSVIPTKIEVAFVKHIAQGFPEAYDECLNSGMLLSINDYILFKHELFRLAIEESLTSSKRSKLNKYVLKLLQEVTGIPINLSLLVHHAKIAGERNLIEKFAPKAAKESAQIGAHREAVVLYNLAIEYSSAPNSKELAELYNGHAHESYLTFQIQQAIDSQKKALEIWHNHEVVLKQGDSLRFLSLLLWYNGERDKALSLARQAIEILETGFPTRELALAYSNLSSLYLSINDKDQSIEWGKKAEYLADRLEDDDLKCAALNTIGTAILCKALNSDAEILFVPDPKSGILGENHLNKSLQIALEKGFHQHAARAYMNLAALFVYSRNFKNAEMVFNEGLKHFEEYDLWNWKYYMVSLKIRSLQESCKWKEAEILSNELKSNSNYSRIITIECNTTVECASALAKLKIRQGKFEDAKKLIAEAKQNPIYKNELHRAVPVLTAELELAWLTGGNYPANEIKEVENMYRGRANSWHYSNLKYWLKKCDISDDSMPEIEFYRPVRLELDGKWQEAAKFWKDLGCYYEQALALLEGTAESQKEGLHILIEIGAVSTAEFYRKKLKNTGLKNIPRGPHESTRNNPAQLTQRQVEILELLQKNLPNREIAEKLFISPKTVDNHLSAIFTQLDVNSRSKAVIEAVKLGVLKK